MTSISVDLIKGGYLPLAPFILRVILFLQAFTYIPKHINFSELTN